jgi:hypothetical protein
MKLLALILIVMVLLALAVDESLAQTSGSASQTVTFGVRRSAPMVLTGAQATSISIKEIGLERTTPLKVTVGSDMQSGAVPEISYASATGSATARHANFASVKSLTTKSTRFDKAVVTLTE